MPSLPLSRDSAQCRPTGGSQPGSVVFSLVSSVRRWRGLMMSAAVLSVELLIGLSMGRGSPGNVYSTNSWVILMLAGPGSAFSAPVTEDEKHKGLCQLRSKGRGPKLHALFLLSHSREKTSYERFGSYCSLPPFTHSFIFPWFLLPEFMI